MSIELDFIKRYGPPKYRIDHKLKFQDDELYVVQEIPNTDLELMNERLKRDTFSRLTKLYPRQGPWALPIKYKIVNNYPAFRRKSGKEVGSITERVYQPTYSHIQRSKGALDPDEQCPPHQKRMSYSATYLRKRARSSLPPDGATAGSIAGYSRASKQNCKPRPKSCPPISSKKNTESREVKKKHENRKQYRRRSFFTFLDENFFSDQSQWEGESTKSYRSKLTFDKDGNDTESKDPIEKVTDNMVNITTDENSSKGSESWDDSFSSKSDYSADYSDSSSDGVDSNSYDSETSDTEQSGGLETSQESRQAVDNDDEKSSYFERNDGSQTPDSSTLTQTSDSCCWTRDTSSDSEDTDDFSPKTEEDDESDTSSQTATHSSEYSSSSHSFKKTSISFEDENTDYKGGEHSSDAKTMEDSSDQGMQTTEDGDELDEAGNNLSANDNNMEDKTESCISSSATASIKSGSQRSLILKGGRSSVNSGSRSSLRSEVTEKSSGNRQSDRRGSRASLRSNITNHSFEAGVRNSVVSPTNKMSSDLKDALGSQTSVRSIESNVARPNSGNMLKESSKHDDNMKHKTDSFIPSNSTVSITSGSQRSLILKGERSSVNSGSQISLRSEVTEKSSGNGQSDRRGSRVSLQSNISNHSFGVGVRSSVVSHTSKKSSSLKDASGSRTSMKSGGSNTTRPNSRNMLDMSKSQTSLKSRVPQHSKGSRPGTGSSVKRSESRTSVKSSPYEADLPPSTVTKKKSHGNLKSMTSKVSVKSVKSTESRNSVTSSRKSSVSFGSESSQKSDKSRTNGGFQIKVNENSSEAIIPHFEENEAKRDELDMSRFKQSTKEDCTLDYDLVHGNIKESEASINQVGKDNENNEVGNNVSRDDVEENLKRVRDLLEELKSPNHNERGEGNRRENEQISEDSSVKNEKAHNSHPSDILLKDGEKSGAQSPTNSKQISEVNHSNNSQNSTNNNKEDVANGNLSDSRRELCETDVDLPEEESSKNLNEDTVHTFFT